MFKLSQRCQRTLARPSARVAGVGFITGADVTLRFRPGSPDSGIVFIRTDLSTGPRILADVGLVSGTDRRTTLGSPPRSVTLVEHVMSALAGLRIDNCVVELDGSEPPGLDGSSAGFVEALLDAGVAPQEARKDVWTVDEPIVLRDGQATLGLHPAHDDEMTVSYMLDYGTGSPIDRQTFTTKVTPGEYAQEIAPGRTFVTEAEAKALQQSGIGARTTYSDLLIFGPSGPIGNELRFANEPARHKVLDLIGDLALCGLDIRGHFVAYRSGHSLNTQFAQTVAQRLTPDGNRPTLGTPRRAA